MLKRKLNNEKKHSGLTMFKYFPKLSRSDANPAGDQSHSETIGEINGPYFLRWPHFFLRQGPKGPSKKNPRMNTGY